MNVLPIPPRPSLAHYKKRAKDLVKAAKSDDQKAIRNWGEGWVETLAKLHGVQITPFLQQALDRTVSDIEVSVRDRVASTPGARDRFTLADAQFLIAQAHGFINWSEFSSHLERPFRGDSKGREFEAAVDAVVTGDLQLLTSLLADHPELARTRSARTHHATLLHYIAANGVEDYRQLTPPNAVKVAELLLKSGAEVDALADTYGGGTDQTTMNLLVSSAHPAEAGLQPSLVEVLLDFGAAIDGLDNNSSPIITALAFGYRDAAETLARRGARLDSIVVAAALGRLDLVRSLAEPGHARGTRLSLLTPKWLGLPQDVQAHLELGCVWACKFGHIEVVDFLLEKRVSPAAKDTDSMTLLHWAAANGYSKLVRRLIDRGAPLEVENRWGGTVLDSTVHFALHEPREGVNYREVIEILITAGANIHCVTPFPTGDQQIDSLLSLTDNWHKRSIEETTNKERHVMAEPIESSAEERRVNLSPAVPILRVNSLDVSVAYYVERLAFRLDWRSDPLASVTRDRTSIMLCEGDQGQPGTWLWIAAGNVDRLYGELQARGARLRHPPMNYPWGSRECQVTDPDGHVLRFAMESKPDEPLGEWLDGEGKRWAPQPDGSWRLAK
jgi:hypothetical protein